MRKAVQIAREIAEALEEAHSRNIVHRDLKPSNIMLDRGGHAKVMDFGLAKRVASKGETQEDTLTSPTQIGSTMGTLPYMSPEQVRGEEVDTRSDIFSFGVIVYEMLAGVHPFRKSLPMETATAIQTETPAPLARYVEDLPQLLHYSVRKMLAKDPRDRYQTVHEIATDLGQAGVESSAPVVADSGPAGTGRKLGPYALTALAVLAIAVLGWWFFRPELQRNESSEAIVTPAATQKSIAVLPFANLSPEPENEYFCDGLTEQLIHTLARVEGLNVPARTSVFALKGKQDLNIREVGRTLGVANVLEGSVRRAGNRLRITAQLIKVEDGFQLWSRSYDRELEDVFAIQDEIAQNIVAALQVTLRPHEQDAMQATRSSSAEAYDYYLRGQGYFRRDTREDIELAREMFSKAVETDPSYAPAYASLAHCYTALFRNYESTAANLEQADRWSKKAVELAPGQAGAHAARGFALSVNRHYARAEEEFETAIRLNPRSLEARYYYALALTPQGKLEEAARLHEEAIELAPDDIRPLRLLPPLYRSLGRDAAEKAAYRRTVEVVEGYLALVPEDVQALITGASALMVLGQRERSLEWLDQVLEKAGEDALVLYNTACIFALGGEVEPALDALEKSYQAGLADPDWMKHDSDLDSIRDHPRFRALLGRMEAQ